MNNNQLNVNEMNDVNEKNNVNDVTDKIQELTNILIKGFQNYKINENNILDFVIRTMVLVEKEKKLSGLEKKAIVIEILFRIIDSSNLEKEGTKTIKLLVKNLAPTMIDTIVSASKGILSINKSKRFFCC